MKFPDPFESGFCCRWHFGRCLRAYAAGDFRGGGAGEETRVGPPSHTATTGGTVVRDSARSGASAMVPAVEPELPNNKVERGTEAYTRGQFCMQAGKDEEAITAFEGAAKIDPAFSDGWNNLAMLYEKTGNEKKALEAFRRSKKVAGS